MKHYKIRIILSLVLACFAMGASAQQSLRSAYFLEGSTYRHQLNPSFMGERNYISIPVLGNMNIGAQGNVGLSTFLYKYNNGNDLTTFMNETVIANEFLGKLKNKNKIGMNLDFTILSAGFWSWGGFNTIDLSMKSSTSLNLPYEFFDFMKSGMNDESGAKYHINNLGANSNNYVEFALGHSRKINDKLDVGAKLKFLFGAGNASVKISDMDIQMSDQQWLVKANGEMYTSVKGLVIPTKGEMNRELKENESPDVISWDDIDYDSPGLAGFGMALDLGATYRLRDDLILSAAILDLGFIKWNNTIKGVTSNEAWTFAGFKDIAVDPEEGSTNKDFDDQLDDLTDGLEDWANFHKQPGSANRSTMLAATLNIGAEYILPYYDRLSFGFLSSTRIDGAYTWSEGRFSANIAPLRWFDASVNYGISTFGSSLGWILNFHPKGFNFFIGTDHMITKVNTQYIPVNRMNANVSLGFNITFGKNRSCCCRK